MQNPQNLIWIDLEMTGLNPDTDVIIEMATIVTDSDLNTLAEGPVIAIHHSDEVLAGMDEWNTRQHGGSGLTQRARFWCWLNSTLGKLTNVVNRLTSQNTIGYHTVQNRVFHRSFS